MPAGRYSQPAFFVPAALLFAASSAATIVGCGSMASTGGMPMPGGWTMSTAWMRMPGQSWPGAAASFLGMWIVIMAAVTAAITAERLAPAGKPVARAGGAVAVAVGLWLLARAAGLGS